MESTPTYQTAADIPANGEVFAVLELMGHKVMAGKLSKDEQYGKPLIRLDIPETQDHPAFTRYYNPDALYSFTPVSEEVAQRTAERISEHPLTVYVPDVQGLEAEIASLQREIQSLQYLLPSGKEPMPERQICPHCGLAVEGWPCHNCAFDPELDSLAEDEYPPPY